MNIQTKHEICKMSIIIECQSNKDKGLFEQIDLLITFVS